MRSVDELVADLRALGVAPGDVVMPHVSLRKVGPVQGRAAGLVEAIDRAVGPDGSWLAMIDAENDWEWVNKRPEAEREALLADAEPFDPQVTPAASYVGAFAEVVRAQPGTVVSDQPEGRFAARGRDAAALVTGVAWSHYYGPGSPLERLVERGGKVLRLGADTDTVTLLHLAENRAEVADKRTVTRHRRVVTPEGPSVVAVECLDDTDGIRPYRPGVDYFTTILEAYLATGRASVGTVGAAPAELLDAADLCAFAVAWMEQHLA